ncbi:MAG: hypothetical protein E7576_00845 [Ruminococcaceae bacterium]|nr:hypothetical protein [Oscillospiraceae bacterium]
MPRKIASEAGADSRTPSIPQYFSWINNTNEGSTEAQTLTNLDFFAWLKREYGMQIRIYAWDAGNFDGASMGYGDPEGAKFRAQYPRGYAPIAEKAAEAGIRMGLWGSPDGFGDTPEEEEKRYRFMVDLCRKYHFALFKLDGVCGTLREEKAEVFGRMLRECREYSPDLIVLNHRLNLYSAERYVTTFLWQGAETYVDVHSANNRTGMHNRCFLFDRGLPVTSDVPGTSVGLERLAEDHGVCLSSSLDYFGDDLIYQAFGRSMILAPEIYGNPWFLRDDEYPMLARIYNLHRKAAPLLVDGFPLPASYGPAAVSRGNGRHRFVVTGNDSWTRRTVTLDLKECGIEGDGRIRLIRRFPDEVILGDFPAECAVSVTLDPFRAYLFELADPAEAFPALDGREYRVIREDEDGAPVEVKDTILPPPPALLGTLEDADPASVDTETLYEAAQFSIDNDSLEARTIRRSGSSSIPEVNACRDAFFAQKTYLARGTEGAFAFDGRSDTFFDGMSRTYAGGLRIMGGCLRVDFGGFYDCDAVEIDCFAAETPTREVPAVRIPHKGEYSRAFSGWKESGEAEIEAKDEDFVSPAVRFSVHSIDEVKGSLLTVRYAVGPLRRFRLAEPMDRIYAVRLMKDGHPLTLLSPKISNLEPHPSKQSVAAVKRLSLDLPKRLADGDYLALAVEGKHGWESVLCAAEFEGRDPAGFPERAPAYQSNVWEHLVTRRDANHTFYLPLSPEDAGCRVTLTALFCDPEHTDARCDVWLCHRDK